MKVVKNQTMFNNQSLAALAKIMQNTFVVDVCQEVGKVSRK